VLYQCRIAWVLKFLNFCVKKILVMNLFSEISFRVSLWDSLSVTFETFLSVPFSGDSFSVLFESFSFRAVSGESLSVPCERHSFRAVNFPPIQLTGDSLSVPVEGDPHSVPFECFFFRVVFRRFSF
jgi:hypothetical protein